MPIITRDRRSRRTPGPKRQPKQNAAKLRKSRQKMAKASRRRNRSA